MPAAHPRRDGLCLRAFVPRVLPSIFLASLRVRAIGCALPNLPFLSFLGIGAQKCGTTWLYEMLARHPEVSFPAGKELHFWDAARHTGIESYRSWLDVRDGKVHGDITPAYGILPPEVIAECREAFPHLRLLYLIRNPIERAWSAACMAVARAEMTPEEASDAWFIDHFRSAGSLARGDYERCLRNWRFAYGEGAVLVLRYEDIARQPAGLLNETCSHLGIAPVFAEGDPALVRRVNPGSGTPIRCTLLPALASIYADRIRSLGRYLRVDLGAWMPP